MAGKKTQKPKKEKQKVTYIDDGSTLFDMSGVGRRPAGQLLPPMHGGREKPEPRTRTGKIWRTYCDAVRAMISPMLVVLGAMAVLFFLVWIILGFFA